MNLVDKDILELNELCNALVEGTLNDAQKARLSHWLATSEDARRFYIRTMGLSASLFSYASEMQTETAETVAPSEKIIDLRWLWNLWKFGALAAAASIALMLWMEWPKQHFAVTQPPGVVSVAQLTGTKGCEWVNSASAVKPGSQLQMGQRIELAKGFVEITFDSGAQVVLQGPASLDVKSAWAATLNHGTLKAHVPPQAVGFSISNPNVDVVDLGTEFTMSADASGAADVLVLKGEVEANPNATPGRQPILLMATESRRFESSGVSPDHDVGQEFAQLTRPIALDYFNPPMDCTHWSFDETNGTRLKADSSGQSVSACDMHLKNVPKGTATATHEPGHWLGALQFDGHLYARAAVPGLSENSPHTVAFWVKVPKDAKLSTAYAMVAWGVNGEKLGSHPIHISWNRNPAEGMIGVLRTDYGGGFALGSTPLRDGQWHHIAVELIPTDDASKTLEVKQYVDGRLEGEGRTSPPGSAVFKQLNEDISINDVLWLGCRLGINGVRTERFRGEMDELYVANRTLEPEEIVQLMTNNKLQLEVAATDESE